MRIMNIENRLHLLVDDRVIDVETASGGLFPADVQSVYGRWEEFRRWFDTTRPAGGSPVPERGVGAPVKRQAFNFAFSIANAQSSQCVSAATSDDSTVAPHQILRPGGASR